MRLNLNSEAEGVFKRVHSRFKSSNRYVDAPNTNFLAQLLTSIEKRMTQDWVESLASDLTAPKLKRKLMRERLTKLADQIDEDALDKLERRITKIENKTERQETIGGKSAEKS